MVVSEILVPHRKGVRVTPIEERVGRLEQTT